MVNRRPYVAPLRYNAYLLPDQFSDASPVFQQDGRLRSEQDGASNVQHPRSCSRVPAAIWIGDCSSQRYLRIPGEFQ